MHYKNLTIIGTSHIAKQSLEQVEATIKKENPGIIALELDKKRFYALTPKVERKISLRGIKKIGLKGFIFSIIGAWIEKKLGRYVGVEPGSEMLKAIELARKNQIKIALIDQDIEITLAKISKTFTWKEKFNFILDLLRGIIFKKKEMKELGITELDLTKVPSKEVIKKLIKKVKMRYPNFYKVLIEERNQIMADNLRDIIAQNPEKKILAIVGAGHEEELMRLIKNIPKISYTFNIG